MSRQCDGLVKIRGDMRRRPAARDRLFDPGEDRGHIGKITIGGTNRRKSSQLDFHHHPRLQYFDRAFMCKIMDPSVRIDVGVRIAYVAATSRSDLDYAERRQSLHRFSQHWPAHFELARQLVLRRQRLAGSEFRRFHVRQQALHRGAREALLFNWLKAKVVTDQPRFPPSGASLTTEASNHACARLPQEYNWYDLLTSPDIGSMIQSSIDMSSECVVLVSRYEPPFPVAAMGVLRTHPLDGDSLTDRRQQGRNDVVEKRAITELFDDALNGRITRRQLMQRAAILGVAVPGLVAMRAAPDVAAATRAQATPTAGGSLRAIVVDDPKFLDIHVTQLAQSRNVMASIYECLTYIDAADPTFPTKGKLASEWTFTEPTKLDFTLQPNVKFHNGEDFTAEDVKWTIEYVKNPETASPNAAIIDQIDTVEVLDPLTVRLNLKQSWPALPSNLSTIQIYSKTATKDSDCVNPEWHWSVCLVATVRVAGGVLGAPSMTVPPAIARWGSDDDWSPRSGRPRTI